MAEHEPTLGGAVLRELRNRLRRAERDLTRARPGSRTDRQPVHVMYGGAQLFAPGSFGKLARNAKAHFLEHAPDAAALASAIGIDAGLAERVHPRVLAKLEREAIEDYRIDFEDGYGHRTDDEEDGHAIATAQALAGATDRPPFVGIRIKALTEALASRSLRTLDLFLTSYVKTGAALPDGFVVTLPKVTQRAQVEALARALGLLERHLGIHRRIPIELMVETPQALVGLDGRIALPGLTEAARGRCRGVHFGAYDYTASLDVTASEQAIDHPACDFARQLMQTALAGSRVWISDGATTAMPVGPHRGPELTPAQREENRGVVHRAWALHHRNVRRALREGLYQGWDLHPGQLPVRYAAVYGFFLEGLPASAARLSAFVARAAQATRLGDVFDDAATGQGLLNFFLRGLACGALSEAEVASAGLSVDELRTRSFLEIVERRRAPSSQPSRGT